MDLTPYKEQLARGETVDFYVSKKRIVGLFIPVLLFALIGGGITLFARQETLLARCIGAVAFFYLGYMALQLWRTLSTRSVPKIILSLDKESLTIYDLSVPALLGKDEPRVSILWTDILRLGIDKVGKQHVIMLQCTPPAIQNVARHLEKVSGKLLRIYDVGSESISLQVASWIDISLKDIETLLKEIHQSATANR